MIKVFDACIATPVDRDPSGLCIGDNVLLIGK
jgi:hypothetical protein